MSSKIYWRIDEESMSLWKYIESDNNITEKIEVDNDERQWLFSKLSEMFVHRHLRRKKLNKFIDNIFSNVTVFQIQGLSPKDNKKYKDLGDIVYFVNCGKKDGKKIVVFEVKHGTRLIREKQLRKLCNVVLNPSEYFDKVNEVRVFYVFVKYIDFESDFIELTFCELTRELAERILDTEDNNLLIFCDENIRDNYLL